MRRCQNFYDLGVGQHPLAGGRCLGTVNARARISLDPAVAVQPGEHGRQRGEHDPGPRVGGRPSVIAAHPGTPLRAGLLDDGVDVVTVDLGDGLVGPAVDQTISDHLAVDGEAEEAGGLPPAPGLRPGMVLDEVAHCLAEALLSACTSRSIDLLALSAFRSATTSLPLARSRPMSLASWRAAASVSG